METEIIKRLQTDLAERVDTLCEELASVHQHIHRLQDQLLEAVEVEAEILRAMRPVCQPEDSDTTTV